MLHVFGAKWQRTFYSLNVLHPIVTGNQSHLQYSHLQERFQDPRQLGRSVQSFFEVSKSLELQVFLDFLSVVLQAEFALLLGPSIPFSLHPVKLPAETELPRLQASSSDMYSIS